MIIHTMPQHLEDGTTNPEWLEVRKGKFTGSDFHQYLPILTKGLSETAKSNLYKKVFERYAPAEEGFKSSAMIRGTELEAEARQEYIGETFADVQEIGFAEYNDYVGCSPDGVIYDNAGKIKKIIEIKCPEPAMFMRNIQGYIKPEYMTQMQFNMMITGATECDFVSYMPHMKLYIKTIEADFDVQAEIMSALDGLIRETIAVEAQLKEYLKGED